MLTSTLGIRGTLTLALSCALTAAAPGICTAKAQPRPVVEAGVAADIRPGDDFFAFANGAWLQATQIPDGQPRWNARNEINDLTRRQVDQLVDDAAGAPVGSNARKVANFRAAYLDEATIEARGVTPLAPTMERINVIGDATALTRFLGSALRADVDPLNLGIYDSAHLLGLSVEPGLQGEANHVAFLLQGGLGLGDRDLYLSTTPDGQALRARYERYIGRMLALAGFDQAEQRAARVMALEVAIAQTHATRAASGDERNANNLWTRADFARQAPGIDWDAFFAAAKLSKQQSFVVWQPGAVTGAAALVASQPLATWLDYLRFHVIHAHVEVLPRAFAEEAPVLRGGEASSQPGSRAQRALPATQQAMSGLLAPTLRETMLGNAAILEIFNISKVGKVAGCRVTDGTVERGANVRLIRDNVVVHEGKLSTLKRFKDEVKEVQSGQECGMAFENYHDMRAGDVIECYRVETIQRSL